MSAQPINGLCTPNLPEPINLAYMNPDGSVSPPTSSAPVSYMTQTAHNYCADAAYSTPTTVTYGTNYT